MKGDERIQTVEERTDSALLYKFWSADFHIQKCFLMNTFSFSASIGNISVFQIEVDNARFFAHFRIPGLT